MHQMIYLLDVVISLLIADCANNLNKGFMPKQCICQPVLVNKNYHRMGLRKKQNHIQYQTTFMNETLDLSD